MYLLGISASPAVASKTLIAVSRAIRRAQSLHADVSVEIINLREYSMQFSDGRDPSLYDGDTRVVIDKVVRSDALIIGTPVYRGSYIGSLKNLFDVLPNDALEGKPVGLVATGGTDHHFLAIEHELKPLIGFFYAHVIPGAVYANNTHYSDDDLVDAGVRKRLDTLSDSVIEFARRVPRHIVGAERPAIPRRSLTEM